ncbi:TetR/AcrR family transcriptional regulator [Microbacterium sp.]|uniref:TetR/AcrR family transcriptional regulator n=1 Tax=Microbacterium sp. TaxID=51671 RepID=UPI003F99B94E
MTERAYHHGDLRAALLARAVDEIDARGVEGLSLRAVARDLGVSHGASARHFRDRAALIDAVAIEGLERLLRAMGTVSKGDPISSAAREYVRFAVEHPRLLAASYAAKRADSASEELVEAGGRMMEFVVELLQRGQKEGVLRSGDAAEQARVAFAAVHGVAMLAVGDLLKDVSWQQATDEVVAFLMTSLRAERTS